LSTSGASTKGLKVNDEAENNRAIKTVPATTLLLKLNTRFISINF